MASLGRIVPRRCVPLAVSTKPCAVGTACAIPKLGLVSVNIPTSVPTAPTPNVLTTAPKTGSAGKTANASANLVSLVKTVLPRIVPKIAITTANVCSSPTPTVRLPLPSASATKVTALDPTTNITPAPTASANPGSVDLTARRNSASTTVTATWVTESVTKKPSRVSARMVGAEFLASSSPVQTFATTTVRVSMVSATAKMSGLASLAMFLL
mmetsp:Transcript_28672/g.40284  ORF Transcript_28672/g.40284 Transcript_28672/m.40284 type:complete len:212 (-) Transcript_28672:788-1423(-)